MTTLNKATLAARTALNLATATAAKDGADHKVWGDEARTALLGTGPTPVKALAAAVQTMERIRTEAAAAKPARRRVVAERAAVRAAGPGAEVTSLSGAATAADRAPTQRQRKLTPEEVAAITHKTCTYPTHENPQPQPIADFPLRSGTRDGFSKWCRECLKGHRHAAAERRAEGGEAEAAAAPAAPAPAARGKGQSARQAASR